MNLHPASEPQPGRIASLDIVRGVAVLGIVVPNIVGMGQPMAAYGWPGGFIGGAGPFADTLWAAQLVLVDGKFRAIFTLLFGAGMVLFYRAALAKGTGGGLLVRRLMFLATFGFLHWLLVWRGDILLPYAIGGLIALPFVAMDAMRRFALGLAMYLVGALLVLGAVSLMTSLDPAMMAEIADADLADGVAEQAIMAAGSYPAWVAHGFAAHWDELAGAVLWTLLETVPLILMGMSLIDARLFESDDAPRNQLRRGAALWLAGIVATGGIAAVLVRGGVTYAEALVAPAWSAFPALPAALGLLAMLVAWARGARGRFAQRLAAAGRCAFTNYIGTSVLALIVFGGWGLGLFGTLGRLELLGVTLAFWVVMLAWPSWWLARFTQGPLEWLWRCLTYGRRFPLRR